MANASEFIAPGWNDILKSYVTQHLPDARLQARLQGEAAAKQILEQKLGNFSEEDIRSFLLTLNTDFVNGKERHNRFMPAFYGSLANQIAASRDAFNSARGRGEGLWIGHIEFSSGDYR